MKIELLSTMMIKKDSENIKSIIKKIDKPLITYGVENSDVDIQNRIKESRKEIKEADWFDYIVVNYPDKIDKAVEELTILLGLIK